MSCVYHPVSQRWRKHLTAPGSFNHRLRSVSLFEAFETLTSIPVSFLESRFKTFYLTLPSQHVLLLLQSSACGALAFEMFLFVYRPSYVSIFVLYSSQNWETTLLQQQTTKADVHMAYGAHARGKVVNLNTASTPSHANACTVTRSLFPSHQEEWLSEKQKLYLFSDTLPQFLSIKQHKYSKVKRRSWW